MCSSCGGGRAARIPGGTPGRPIVFGAANGQTAQPATFLVDYPPHGTVGQYKYVSGDGVDAAIADGTIKLGYKAAGRSGRTRSANPETVPSPDWYVRTGNNRWVGFKVRVAADRYAKSVGGVVQSRDEVLQLKKDGGS